MGIGLFESHPAIGIAYSDYIPMFLNNHLDAVDYVEIPFELLRHKPSLIEIQKLKPLILHCASLSIAGFVPPDEQTVQLVKYWTEKTKTPWLGEHLAFITAGREEVDALGNRLAIDRAYDVGYSVNPPANAAHLQQILHSVEEYEKRLGVPILLENSPTYFVPPGSTMTQSEFIREVCEHSNAQLLLDITHFYITSQTLGFDPLREILSLPLDRVLEVHISGVDMQHGIYWDDHTRRAPEIIYELLALVLAKSRLKAVTLEYNWSVRFPQDVLLQEIARAKEILSTAARQWT
jgi:uncharacterized protein